MDGHHGRLSRSASGVGRRRGHRGGVQIRSRDSPRAVSDRVCTVPGAARVTPQVPPSAAARRVTTSHMAVLPRPPSHCAGTPPYLATVFHWPALCIFRALCVPWAQTLAPASGDRHGRCRISPSGRGPASRSPYRWVDIIAFWSRDVRPPKQAVVSPLSAECARGCSG